MTVLSTAMPVPAMTTAARPRDAAAILVLQRGNGAVRVLMGKRSSAHAFMPDVHVFPGGRRDRGDYRIAIAADLHPAVFARLRLSCGASATDGHLRALAIAALRELHEEAHIAIGQPQDAAERALPFRPDLSKLRYIARAVTPATYPRRFDTHFFALFTDEAGIDPADPKDSRELQDLRWIDVNDASSVTIPDITGVILAGLADRLSRDPTLAFGKPVPFYFTRRGRLIRDRIV